ncbi:MAG TPA: polysaccharide deacetylase family protein [Acidobacteriota bacterium]|nr:polysaccharide deacetylase family protein [Acidobacteriota bacterium]
MKTAWLICLGLLIPVLSTPSSESRVRGVMVLAFDDGYPSWIKTIAPELAAVNGVATGFVNNYRVRSGELRFEDLVVLQDKYRWEIGTHTYHHFNAPDFVKRHGIEKWFTEEVEASVKELEEWNLRVESLVFPYNAFSPELAAKVARHFTSYRRRDVYPIADGRRADGSVPAAGIDIAGYTPLDLMLKWIDQAARNKQLLFLYGHNVLPDSEFFVGRVVSIDGPVLTSDQPITLDPAKSDLYLVPDMTRRIFGTNFRVESVEGKTIKVSSADLIRFTSVGSSFLIGPGYGTRLSDFRRLLSYASQKLEFKTVREAVGRH